MAFDKRLDWKPEVASLTNKLRAVKATISEAPTTTDKCTAITVCETLFEAYLRYGILSYGAAFRNTLKALETVQNQVVRRILRASRREYVEALYEESAILPLNSLYLRYLLTECTIRNPQTAQALTDSLRPTDP